MRIVGTCVVLSVVIACKSDADSAAPPSGDAAPPGADAAHDTPAEAAPPAVDAAQDTVVEAAPPGADAAADTGGQGLTACTQCAQANTACGCLTMDCIQCMFVDPAGPSCAAIPQSARNAICTCMEQRCRDTCPPSCRR